MNNIEKINKDWDFVIGIEVHVQLETKSKMFSTCEYSYDQDVNTLTCPTSLGLPGALPSINEKAIDFAIKFGSAVGAKVHSSFSFSRKHYFYPDLPKGYQISQFDQPIVTGGVIPIWWNEKKYDIQLTRAHLEEDAGKSTHNSSNNNSELDFNRSGAPLIEIVTEPVLTHPVQAKILIQRIKQIVNYITISHAEMEQGKLRCDANISIKKKGIKEFGTKTEIKNINSFKNVQKAIESEIKRQHDLLSKGDSVKQATLTWNNERNTAEIMRIKENADDYRYFPEPDLPPVEIDKKHIDSIKKLLPTLPFELEEKWMKDYNFTSKEASILSSTSEIASYFEKMISNTDAKDANKWITGELFRLFNEENEEFDDKKINPNDLSKIIALVNNGEVTAASGKEILRKLFNSDSSIDFILNKGDYLNNTDHNIKDIIKKVLKDNPNEVKRFQDGEDKLLSYFMGKVMKESKGKINHEIIIQELNNSLKKS
ncbi:MAG TPA: Asp-tRNA(Asn)/Glu-tRNA(Gln) amidotransferase subunit GatB [Candidatus Marinimicrobia bacterium]|nr:Asp-tRNA(Asn)/Glu-tRNA(Gln) amidotransferase subunit GatB [Candidatus Neomarinimicrobiota bacterium]